MSLATIFDFGQGFVPMTLKEQTLVARGTSFWIALTLQVSKWFNFDFKLLNIFTYCNWVHSDLDL